MFELSEFTQNVVDVATDWAGISNPAIPLGWSVAKSIIDIPSRIMMYKLCWILSKQEPNFSKWLKMKENFDKDASKYNKTVRQLVLCINAINEESMLDVYANLLRSWQLGLIDKEKFLRLTWMLPNIYSEDLFCLKEVFRLENMDECPELVSLHSIGLASARIPMTCGSSYTSYNINKLGLDMLQFGVDFEHYENYREYRRMHNKI